MRGEGSTGRPVERHTGEGGKELYGSPNITLGLTDTLAYISPLPNQSSVSQFLRFFQESDLKVLLKLFFFFLDKLMPKGLLARKLGLVELRHLDLFVDLDPGTVVVFARN